MYCIFLNKSIEIQEKTSKYDILKKIKNKIESKKWKKYRFLETHQTPIPIFYKAEMKKKTRFFVVFDDQMTSEKMLKKSFSRAHPDPPYCNFVVSVSNFCTTMKNLIRTVQQHITRHVFHVMPSSVMTIFLLPCNQKPELTWNTTVCWGRKVWSGFGGETSLIVFVFSPTRAFCSPRTIYINNCSAPASDKHIVTRSFQINQKLFTVIALKLCPPWSTFC